MNISLPSFDINLSNWLIPLATAGIILSWFLTARMRRRRRSNSEETTKAAPEQQAETPPPELQPEPEAPQEPENESDRIVTQMLAQYRYSLLLRPQIAETLSQEQRRRAESALDRAMAILPAGQVVMEPWHEEATIDGEAVVADKKLAQVEAVYLDRYPVTNAMYQVFVNEGGYEQMPLWEQEIWPAVLDFVDQTGHPGPKLWRDGKHLPAHASHPVVGVSWYEACAYARWVGKRLPSDPEWVKAGCWPVAQGNDMVQRRFPWGDTMDRNLAHLWRIENHETAPVTAFADGVSVGGVYQLIGNVWEWTTSLFGVWNGINSEIEISTPMRSLRGGAFDTYFDSQACCQFQSGDDPLARKRNIGFRCAVAYRDVATTELIETDDVGEPVAAGA